MTNFPTHPEEAVLLRYCDGELPSRKARQLARHLQACWQCRAEVEEMQTTVADCVRYRNHVLAAHLPAPPTAWPDLSAGFARIDAELAAGSWMRWFALPKVRRWAVSFAALALALFTIYYQFRHTPPVEAAALLKRAIYIAETQPRPKHQIRVRTRVREFRVTPPAVRALFQSANYNAVDPMSAKSYQQWRDGLAGKTDEVAVTPVHYRIRTVTQEGALAIASLTLRATDLHPTEGRFEFRNQEWVELTEVSEASTQDDGLSVETKVEAPMRRAVPSRPEAAPTGGSALVSEELQVVAALHEIGADLGDPVEVTRSGGKVVVSGMGVSPQRQGEIRRALGFLSNVAVQFAEPPAAPEALSATPAPASGGQRTAIQSRFEQQMGGRAEFVRFSAQILDWSDAAMAHAHALRALAQRFPADRAQSMTAGDRVTLSAMARAHLIAMDETLDRIQRTLAPVLVSLGGSSAQGRQIVGRGAGWQPAAEDLFQAGRRAEVLLSSVLGVTQDAGAPERAPSDVMAALADFRMNLDYCRRLLGE